MQKSSDFLFFAAKVFCFRKIQHRNFPENFPSCIFIDSFQKFIDDEFHILQKIARYFFGNNFRDNF